MAYIKSTKSMARNAKILNVSTLVKKIYGGDEEQIRFVMPRAAMFDFEKFTEHAGPTALKKARNLIMRHVNSIDARLKTIEVNQSIVDDLNKKQRELEELRAGGEL